MPTAVLGSTQWDLTYNDRDAQLAGVVAQRYAETLVRARNDHDKLLINRGQQELRGRIKRSAKISTNAVVSWAWPRNRPLS